MQRVLLIPGRVHLHLLWGLSLHTARQIILHTHAQDIYITPSAKIEANHLQISQMLSLVLCPGQGSPVFLPIPRMRAWSTREQCFNVSTCIFSLHVEPPLSVLCSHCINLPLPVLPLQNNGLQWHHTHQSVVTSAMTTSLVLVIYVSQTLNHPPHTGMYVCMYVCMQDHCSLRVQTPLLPLASDDGSIQTRYQTGSTVASSSSEL